MSDNRLTKKMFMYHFNCIGKTWCSEIMTILQQVQMLHCYENKLPVNLKDVEDALFVQCNSNWCNNVGNVAKLRTYIKCKQSFGTETYMLSSMTKVERSHLAQFLCGVLPLKIKTGR